MGMKALRKIQIGEEATKGTAVAATAALLGVLTMKDAPVIHRPAEERGSFAEHGRSLKVANFAELSFDGDATFEQVLYLLHMGILGNVTPTGAGTAKKWLFTPSMAAAGTFDSFTMEFGDDVQAWEAEYCMAKLIELTGVMEEPVKVRGDIFARKTTTTTFTPSLSPPTVESIITQRARLFIDDHAQSIWVATTAYSLYDLAVPTSPNGFIYQCTVAGTSDASEPSWPTVIGDTVVDDGVTWTCITGMGITEKAATLIGFTFTVSTGLKEKRLADGSIDFSAYAEAFRGVELRMTFSFNSGANTERAKFDGTTPRLVSIRILGGEAETPAASGDTVLDDPLSATATTLNVTSGLNFTKNSGIKIESEHLWITNIVANALTVVRGWNGTAAAAHVATTAITILKLKELILDFCGVYTAWDTLADRDGEDVVEVTLSSQLSDNYSKVFEIAVVNKVTTLP